jgi:hypothetical protein
VTLVAHKYIYPLIAAVASDCGTALKENDCILSWRSSGGNADTAGAESLRPERAASEPREQAWAKVSACLGWEVKKADTVVAKGQ